MHWFRIMTIVLALTVLSNILYCDTDVSRFIPLLTSVLQFY